ncbi:hypothetical protein HYFRA_00010854 [Hymenoscyphus fraxineus]|uniref:BTB domain-containing protein n=1 Tax=Hymenoscyphus fraxineus TaxID=746836 RepID=A0A9N9KWH1_9HELO|nr:hypothetical protein HYFRA_00010854 [Hymenoscyphus fraxineus]
MARRSESCGGGATLDLFFPTLPFPSTRFGIRTPTTTTLAGLFTTTTPSSGVSFTPTGNHSNIFGTPQVVVASEMANTAPSRGENSMSDKPVTSTMLSSGRYSDLEFVCKGKSFKVHKAVVCLQSRPIAAAIDGGFKEAVESKFVFEDEDAKTVELFVQFLYLREYDDGSRKQEASEGTRGIPISIIGRADIRGVKDFDILRNYEATMYSNNNSREWWKVYTLDDSPSTSTNPPKNNHNHHALLQNAKLYIMAEKYDVQPLKFMAEQKYTLLAPSTWNSPAFITSLRLLYKFTPESDSLMNYAIRIASHHVSTLIDRPDYALLCKEHGELSFAIMKALAHRRYAFDATPPTVALGKSYATLVREAMMDPRGGMGGGASRGRGSGAGGGAGGAGRSSGRN